MDEKVGGKNTVMDEIIGSTPGWIIQWGITVVLVIFVSLVVLLSIIKYPVSQKSPAFIEYIYKPIVLEVPVKSTINRIEVLSSNLVERGKVIMKLKDVAVNKIYEIEAPVDGYLYFFDKWEIGAFVSSNLLLGYIIPEPNERIIKLKISNHLLTKVKLRQQIKIVLNSVSEINETLNGYIDFIAPSEKSDSTFVNVKLTYPINQQLNAYQKSTSSIPCTISISTDTVSYLSHIFQVLH
ncbi:MAG TPA: HlyD family efflux transporter periplasmic adaptor subunit [Candidatus Dojkabacteria bacterium]|nr:HlyD family efflux transporter periplasmic adaptor subunit [Candidatus Dojkabacteria bacterium]